MAYVCIPMCIYIIICIYYTLIYSQSSIVIANFQNMFINRITLVVQFVIMGRSMSI